MERTYNVGIYCRLSKDDDRPGESMSIETQRAMLTEYCEKNGYNIYGEYVDDGFTGTNFERDAFQRLLNDIDAGAVNMVLTKDLSRLGRDYIQMGYYTEIYFPARGVRYIALNDGFDSEKSVNDIAPFMNILNDMYARDISRKVKAAKLQRAKKGLFIAGEAPYGYKNVSGRLEPDPEAAKVVLLIFELAAEGFGEVRIAQELQTRGILSPSSYKANKGLSGGSHGRKTENPCVWSFHSIGAMLRNRVYLGELSSHRTEVVNHKTKQLRKVPKEEQIILPNAHTPLVEEALFQKVQQIRSSHPCPANYFKAHIFRGLLFCSGCGHPLSVAHRKLKYREEDLYRCMRHYYYPKECTKTHAVYHNALSEFVLEQIHALAKSMKRRKVASPIVKYLNAETLTAEMLQEVIERIEVGHIGRRTQLSRAVSIVWKL